MEQEVVAAEVAMGMLAGDKPFTPGWEKTINSFRKVKVHRTDGTIGWYPQIMCKNGYYDMVEGEMMGCPDEKTADRKIRHRMVKFLHMEEPRYIDAPTKEVYHQTLGEAKLDFRGSRGLWIGSGVSSEELLGWKPEWFDNRYGVVVCANGSWLSLDRLASQCERAKWLWLDVERATSANWQDKISWQERIPDYFMKFQLAPTEKVDCLCWCGAEARTLKTDRYVVVAKAHNEPFNPRKYGKGLQIGKEEEGTVTLQAMHLMAALGVDGIDAYGCELDWVDGAKVHFYETESVEQPHYQRDQWDKAARYIASVLPLFHKAGIPVTLPTNSRIMKYVI